MRLIMNRFVAVRQPQFHLHQVHSASNTQNHFRRYDNDGELYTSAVKFATAAAAAHKKVREI